ncbi:hypothetical protein [Pyxidicoccus xibeiensis]|uniref:hypothetical protein n=1 Tax=Pyxidicoccus xibeiensis TaxID=2906759 RepID=UPI0020A76FB8|nr:hypothetical protein [Pyxidicoccus xibeiensis]MCP3140619.1 hypothetical protein [Pyxidicoccus xibeiensis]
MTPNLIQSTLAMLREVERHASTAEQLDAIQATKPLLHFILERGESGEFAAFIEHFDTAPLTALLSFSTRTEADDWLLNHPAPPHGAIIRAANDLYTVVDARALNQRTLLHLPSTDEATGLDGSEEEQEVREEAPPPAPRPGARFSLFDHYKWACYYLSALEKRLSSPQHLEAIRTARLAFDFVMRMGEEHGFEDYVGSIRSARAAPPFRSFARQEDADTWLDAQPEPPPSVVVAVGNELYAVGYNRRGRRRVLTRIPTNQELAAGEL